LRRGHACRIPLHQSSYLQTSKVRQEKEWQRWQTSEILVRQKSNISTFNMDPQRRCSRYSKHCLYCCHPAFRNLRPDKRPSQEQRCLTVTVILGRTRLSILRHLHPGHLLCSLGSQYVLQLCLGLVESRDSEWCFQASSFRQQVCL